MAPNDEVCKTKFRMSTINHRLSPCVAPRRAGSTVISVWWRNIQKAGNTFAVCSPDWPYNVANIACAYLAIFAVVFQTVFLPNHTYTNALPVGLGVALLISVMAAFILVPLTTIYGFFAGIAAWKDEKRANIARTKQLFASILQAPCERLRNIIGFFVTQLENRLDPDRTYLHAYDIIGNPVESLRCAMPAVQISAP